MPRCWSAEFFLEFLNDQVCVEDKKVRSCTEKERGGQQSFPFDTAKKLIFAQEVDVVIVGFCSWEEGTMHTTWLRGVMNGMKPKNVLMFAECCGSYQEEFQKKICSMFPEYTWLFPDMLDLINLGNDRANMIMVQCLMKAGILGVEKDCCDSEKKE